NDEKNLDFVICLNYGGRAEIIDAVNDLIASGAKTPVSEEDLRKHFYLPDVPDPDLIIRTSGELRLSNFWLWESAYSEFYFTDIHWPDFDKAELDKALENYAGRDRRYGGLKK
ncbi:MAG: undecaprenyl diphosphate synthase family protein, partial [Synergistaceae bacterium]|nr:undecaprenyl diphosphate synthase family protein [Synergistaceae bacterium]